MHTIQLDPIEIIAKIKRMQQKYSKKEVLANNKKCRKLLDTFQATSPSKFKNKMNEVEDLIKLMETYPIHYLMVDLEFELKDYMDNKDEDYKELINDCLDNLIYWFVDIHEEYIEKLEKLF